MTDQLIPREPRRKKQPTADVLREQLRLAADEIIRLRGELLEAQADGGIISMPGPLLPEAVERLRERWRGTYGLDHEPWWRRVARRIAAVRRG